MAIDVPRCDIDFYGDEVIRDPYPFYARLREAGAVVHLSRRPGGYIAPASS